MIGLGSDKKKKLGPLDKKIEMICLAIGQYQPGIFYLQKPRISKIHTFYKKLPLLLNFTQFYIPSRNSNLKMNLYGKLHFLKNNNNQEAEYILGILDYTQRWEIKQLDIIASTLES